uniref:Interferon regulatory factor like protein n=1 Tax=Ciona intestinalis TaxID=7719 RepID=Q4H3B4_CIOIN|nr:interferon regulatory factor like protein [Ciona intestinalis]BAE06513.1 interferon regulatory factor like protein [Ciona intestinalis]|eukprot:NP_001071742.1 interferon regulatory factor like protein [Ciona intestinalis]
METADEIRELAPEYRDRLRTWLIKMIESGKIPGLMWENPEKTIFRMPWKHAGRQDYNLEEDSKIFMAWAKHSGRYREGVDKPEPIVWKTRLRCALNKMPDIQEIPERSRLDISEPYRVYRLLPPVHKASQIRRRLFKRSQSHDTDAMTSYGNPLPTSSRVTSQINNQRRSSSIELSERQPLTSPPGLMTSPPSLMTSPNLWYPPSYPLKHQLSSYQLLGRNNLEGGFNLGRSPLPPLNPPFHTSLAPLTPFLSGGNTSLALRHQPTSVMSHVHNMAAQMFAVEHKYRSQLNLTRKLEAENESLKASEQAMCRRLNEVGVAGDEIIGGASTHSLFEKLSETEERVRSLERELAQYRSAHARERCERERLEAEREKMQNILGRIETSTSFNDDVIVSKQTENRETHMTSAVADVKPYVTHHVNKTSMSLKRINSPLDLSVEATSSKNRKSSFDQSRDTTWSEDFLTNRRHSNVTSPPTFRVIPMTSQEEKPSSRSSCSSDSTTSRDSYRGRSLSPPQRSSHLASHRNTIQVT